MLEKNSKPILKSERFSIMMNLIYIFYKYDDSKHITFLERWADSCFGDRLAELVNW